MSVKVLACNAQLPAKFAGDCRPLPHRGHDENDVRDDLLPVVLWSDSRRLPFLVHGSEGSKAPRKLRLSEVLARVGVKKTKLYGQIKKGLFPKQRKLMADSRSVGWLEEDIEKYEAELEAQHSASSKAQVTEPAKEAAISAPSRTLRAPAKPSKSPNNHQGRSAASDDVLVPTGMVIMGCPVFLHKESGKVRLDIGHMASPLTGNSLTETLTAR